MSHSGRLNSSGGKQAWKDIRLNLSAALLGMQRDVGTVEIPQKSDERHSRIEWGAKHIRNSTNEARHHYE